MDDAVDAFLRAGAIDACNGEVFNVGGDEPISHRDLATLLVDAGRLRARATTSPWPPEKKAIDIGSFYADSTQVQGATGWAPTVPLREGLARTIAFYRAHSSATSIRQRLERA